MVERGSTHLGWYAVVDRLRAGSGGRPPGIGNGTDDGWTHPAIPFAVAQQRRGAACTRLCGVCGMHIDGARLGGGCLNIGDDLTSLAGSGVGVAARGVP
jgi:hypothetical protein